MKLRPHYLGRHSDFRFNFWSSRNEVLLTSQLPNTENDDGSACNVNMPVVAVSTGTKSTTNMRENTLRTKIPVHFEPWNRRKVMRT